MAVISSPTKTGEFYTDLMYKTTVNDEHLLLSFLSSVPSVFCHSHSIDSELDLGVKLNCSHLLANCMLRRSLSLSTGTQTDTYRPQAQHYDYIFWISRWSIAAGGVRGCQPDLQFSFWATHSSSPPPVLSSLIDFPHFWDKSCRLLNVAQQPLSQLRFNHK